VLLGAVSNTALKSRAGPAEDFVPVGRKVARTSGAIGTPGFGVPALLIRKQSLSPLSASDYPR